MCGVVSQVLIMGVAFLIGLFCIAVGLYSLRKGQQKTLPFYFSFLLYIFLFCFGASRALSSWEHTKVEWSPDVCRYNALLVTTPQLNERTISVDALCLTTDGDPGDECRYVRLYIKKDSRSITLRAGEVITFDAKVQVPINRTGSDTFDYVKHLAIKDVSGISYVDSNVWDVSQDLVVNRIPTMLYCRIKALQWRDNIIKIYHESELNKESLALLSALTLGDKSYLKPTVKSLYAEVGVSHILALSGMHLGFLVAVFNLLLLRLCVRHWMRVVGILIVLLFVWCYAFVAGLPPSLVRASTMYSLMLTGSLLGRHGFSLNSLGVSAVVMLLVQPLLIYDVGFCLSFLAMLGILMIYPDS